MLSGLLGAKDLSFHLTIEQLENASGQPNADIRLSTEVLQRTQQKIRLLGLDPIDTTAQELYESLLERVRSDNDRLESALIHQKEHNRITTGSIAKTLKAVSMPRSCFAIRHSVAKRLLKADQPKSTLKRLGYRSLDSMLKREPIMAIFAAAQLIESSSWNKKLLDQYNSLKPGDFETRDIEVFAPINTRWDNLVEDLLRQERMPIVACKELGGLVLLPLPLDLPGSTLATLLLAIKAINDIRVNSAFCKLQQVKPNFGEIIAGTSRNDSHSLVLIGGQPLPWYVIQKHYSKFPEDYPLELFEPHVHQEDLQLVQIEEVLTYIEPSLEFWLNTDYLGYLKNKQPVSLNLIDIATACSNRLTYTKRITNNLRQNLWCELLLRYFQEKELESSVVRQLDSQLVESQDDPAFSMAFA
jgi:hypothetical protein